MTTTDTVALIGAIATPTVALAGYGFNVWRASQDRESSKELAAGEQAHELRLALGSRAYEDQKAAYRRVVGWAVRTMHQVELTLPVISTSGTPEPPKDIPSEEYEVMNTEVILFGSKEVAEVMAAFHAALQSFRSSVWMFNAMKDQPPRPPTGTGDEVGSFEQVEQAREKDETSAPLGALVPTLRPHGAAPTRRSRALEVRARLRWRGRKQSPPRVRPVRDRELPAGVVARPSEPQRWRVRLERSARSARGRLRSL